jgi:hypothetical protein
LASGEPTGAGASGVPVLTPIKLWRAVKVAEWLLLTNLTSAEAL